MKRFSEHHWLSPLIARMTILYLGVVLDLSRTCLCRRLPPQPSVPPAFPPPPSPLSPPVLPGPLSPFPPTPPISGAGAAHDGSLQRAAPLLRPCDGRAGAGVAAGPGAGGCSTWGRGNKTVAYPFVVQDMQEKVLSSCMPRRAGPAESRIEFPAGEMSGYRWIQKDKYQDMNG